MRISTTQIFQTGIDQIQRGQAELNRTSLQLGRGERILNPSDDPGGTTQVNQFERFIQSTQQFQRNIDNIQPRLQQEESALQGATEFLQRARELVVAGNNDSQTRETRGFLAGELRQLREGLVDIANTRDPNGEFLFAGTQSQQQPFQRDGDGTVEYTGAQGTGSVREVNISSNRRVQIGDDGARVFMEIPENDGRVGAEVINREPDSRLVIEQTGVNDLTALDDQTFTIGFQDLGSGELGYEIRDESNAVIASDSYTPGVAITFEGRSITLSGTPEVGDEVESRPAQSRSVFETLDGIIEALERGGTTAPDRARLGTASNRALVDLDAALGNFSDVRAEVGTRLRTLEQQQGLNEDRLLDLNTAVSEIRDLDFAEAISRFNQQQVALQAAQQTYTQVNRLSLFDFL